MTRKKHDREYSDEVKTIKPLITINHWCAWGLSTRPPLWTNSLPQILARDSYTSREQHGPRSYMYIHFFFSSRNYLLGHIRTTQSLC